MNQTDGRLGSSKHPMNMKKKTSTRRHGLGSDRAPSRYREICMAACMHVHAHTMQRPAHHTAPHQTPRTRAQHLHSSMCARTNVVKWDNDAAPDLKQFKQRATSEGPAGRQASRLTTTKQTEAGSTAVRIYIRLFSTKPKQESKRKQAQQHVFWTKTKEESRKQESKKAETRHTNRHAPACRSNSPGGKAALGPGPPPSPPAPLRPFPSPRAGWAFGGSFPRHVPERKTNGIACNSNQ